MTSTRTILLGLLVVYLSTYEVHTARRLSVYPGQKSRRPGGDNADILPTTAATPVGQPSPQDRLRTLLPDHGNIGQLSRGGPDPNRRTGNRGNRITGTGDTHTGNSPSATQGPAGRIRTNAQRIPPPPTSRFVNYTYNYVRQNYPWIQNPSLGNNNGRSNHTDGFFRFNNPNYLRDLLDGLTRDYTFRARNGVKAGNGKYKVKIEQVWRNIPVYGAAIVFDQEEDAELVLDSADGEFLTGIGEDIPSEHPSISDPEAIRLAKQYNGDMNIATEDAKTRLVVDTVGDLATLVYIVDYFVPGPSSAAQEPAIPEPNVADVQAPEIPSTAVPQYTTTRAPTTYSAVFNVFNLPPLRLDYSNFARSMGGNAGAQRGPAGQSRSPFATPTMRPIGTGGWPYSFGNNRAQLGKPTTRWNPRQPVRPTEPATTQAPVTPPPVTPPPGTPPPVPANLKGESRRPYIMLDANTGTIIKAWDGLTGLSRHSRSSRQKRNTLNIRPWLVNIVQGNPVYGYRRDEEYMYRDLDADNCYYQTPLGGGYFMRVNDRTTSLTANVIRFPCPEAAKVNYDTDRSQGSLSPRNAAFKWGVEAIRYLKSVTANTWKWDLNIEVHHPGIIARWTGGKVQLGDGDTQLFYAMTAPDTVTHELAHAFTEHTSDLEYNYQSGAINEAFSDMAASAFLDYFFKYPEHQVYLIGRLAIRNGKSLRDMCNPRSTNLLTYRADRPYIVHQLEYESTTNLHNASALYNKAFCTLSKMPGWNIQTAFKIFATANAVYWKPTETFDSAACKVMKAAYSIRFSQRAVNDVIDSFRGVGITCNDVNWINIPKRSRR